MSYRKIDVDGKIYEYSIGKTHTKIRHVGAWKNEEVGALRQVQTKECADWEHVNLLQVTPKDLTWFIRSGKFRFEEKMK
jgi:hypothetical protein